MHCIYMYTKSHRCFLYDNSNALLGGKYLSHVTIGMAYKGIREVNILGHSILYI